MDNQLLRQLILQELDGPGRLLEYRALWRKLQLKCHIPTPRSAVHTLLHELDPEEWRLRHIHRLKRRGDTNWPVKSWPVIFRFLDSVNRPF